MPTSKVLFLTSQYIKDNTVIDNNVDSELINPFIFQSQNVNIESVIGTGLFNEITTQIIGSSVSDNNQTLLNDYILPALKEWVVYHSLPFLNYKITNKSVAKKDSENSTASGLSEIIYLRSAVRDIAEFLSQRLTNFLCENKETYPLYSNPGTGVDVIRPNTSNYFNGIYLD